MAHMLDLHEAARYDDDNRLEYLIAQGLNVDTRDADGQTPLHISCRCGNSRCTAQLVASGASPNAANTNGYTPLHFAALTDQQASSIQIHMLLAAGANMESRLLGDHVYGQVRDWTPLMLAAYEGHAEAVGALAKGGGPCECNGLVRHDCLYARGVPNATDER